MKKTDKKQLGDAGEKIASQYLRNNGYKIICSNFRTPYGEIDIVAEENDTMVFAEVKTRSSEKYGKGYDAVTPQKLERMFRSAEYYITENKINKNARLDVISIDLSSERKITHLKGVNE